MSEQERDLKRARLRDKMQAHNIERADYGNWFEMVYNTAQGDASLLPWADLEPNPHLQSWLASKALDGQGKRALVVGCGLGDDAEALAARGFQVTAFDVSSSAIAWAQQRFPDSTVNYLSADLLKPPSDWLGIFDLVFEAYTLQSLPDALRPDALRAVAGFVKSGGTLLVVARGRDGHDAPKLNSPHPLTKDELDGFLQWGLVEVRFDDFLDEETPPVRRFRVEYQKSIK